MAKQRFKFTLASLFVENLNTDHYLIAPGNKVGQKYMLDVDTVKIIAAMFVEGTCVIVDFKICFKYIGHVYVQRLRMMQN